LLSHEWSLMRVISLEASGTPLGAEPSILKIRGSEIQQELSRLLLECAGSYALPFVAAGLRNVNGAQFAAGDELNSLAAQYFDMRKVSIFAGTTEVQKNIIAKAVLGL
jgi:alkylation response protein AidB-like acyl-CoA dehydrogenase